MKKIILLSILIFITACSIIYKSGKIGSAKNFDPNFSFPTPFQPTVTPVSDSGNSIKVNGNPISSTNHDTQIVKVQRQGPGQVVIPILLYHHVLEGKPKNLYSISSTIFREQLSYLKENGYHTISASALVEAIVEGADLSEKPVLITFDDGNENIFLNAFPIMKEYKFTGVVYLIANRLNTHGYLSVDQIKELMDAGWEIGSHSTKHTDLVQYPDSLRNEIGNSKHKLEDALGIEIITFAYPYGKASNVTKDWVKRIGYLAGMGLGITNRHDERSLFYLSRRQVDSNMNILVFSELLSYN